MMVPLNFDIVESQNEIYFSQNVFFENYLNQFKLKYFNQYQFLT